MRVVVVVIVAVALAVTCWWLDWRAIAAALAAARLAPVALAVVVNLLARTWVRARRTQVLVGGRGSLAALVRMHLAGYAAGTVLPGPAEEVLCCMHLARTHGFAARALVRLQVVDKALGVVSIALVAIALLPLPAAVVVGSVATATLVLAVPRWRALVGWLVVSNALCVAMIGLCLVAVGVDVSPRAWLEIFLAISVGGAVTLLPGQLGTLESAFAVIAARHGVPAAAAIAAALLYRIAFAPSAVAGIPMLWRLSKTRQDPAQPRDPPMAAGLLQSAA